MSDDLISRKAVLNILAEERVRSSILASPAFMEMLAQRIKKLPTTFDKEKVTDKLEKLRVGYFLTIANTGDKKLDCAYEHVGNTLDKSLEIVEKGGVE